MPENVPIRRAAAVVAAGVLCLGTSGVVRAAVLPPYYVESVVSLGTNINCKILAPGQPQKCDWFNVGTAFEYGFLTTNDPDLSKRRYTVFLVTARHVVCGPIDPNNISSCAHPQELIARFNPTTSGPGREFKILRADASGSWQFHPNPMIDVAIIPVEVDLRSEGLQANFIASDVQAEDIKNLRDNGVSAGDGVFVIGFPMQLAGVERNYAVVRQGVIARISELLDGISNSFLIDSFVFPGNSGGPVFSRPDFLSITGTKNQSGSYLIGLVLAYQSYTDVAVSPQTGHARVTFEENSGLAEVLPTDNINIAIKTFLDRNPQLLGGPSRRPDRSQAPR